MNQNNSLEPTIVLGATWSAFKAKLNDFAALALIYLGIYAVIFVPTSVIGSQLSNLSKVGNLWGLGLIALPLLILGVVVFFLAMALISAAVLFVATEEARDWRQAMRLGWQRLWPVAWLSFLSAVIAILGFVALVVPGLMFITFASVSAPALIKERLSAWQAIKRSVDYVKGKAWRVFLVLFFCFIIAILLNMLLGALISPLGLSKEVHDQAVNGIAGLLTTPLWAVLSYQLYQRLKQ